MKLIAMVVGVAACGGPQGSGGGEREGDSNHLPRKTLPAIIKRFDVVTESKGIAGVLVSVEPTGNVGYTVTVKNETDAPIKIVWDDSNYVMLAGAALGRMIRGATQRGHVDAAQPASTVPPGAIVSEFAVPEKMADAIDNGKTLGGKAGETSKIYLAFVVGGASANWEGGVTVGDSPKNMGVVAWCFPSRFGVLSGLCFGSSSECESMHETLASIDTPVGSCGLTPHAFCFSFSDDDSSGSCLMTMADCDNVRDRSGAGATRCEKE
jgi:hypothetical protein